MILILIAIITMQAVVLLIMWKKDTSTQQDLMTCKKIILEYSTKVSTYKNVLRRILTARLLYTCHPTYKETRRQIEDVLKV